MYQKQQTLIICPPTMKDYAIEKESSSNWLSNVKIMSTSEVKEQLFFSISKKTIIYLCEKYNFLSSFAENIITYLYYIDINKTYTFAKLNFLKNIKIVLLEQKLLKTNPLFIKYLSEVNITFKYFDTYTQDDLWLFEQINKVNNINIPPLIKSNKIDNIKELNEFATLDEECVFLFDSFALLLENGVSPEKIILLNATSSSYFTLNRFAKFYNIAIDLPSNSFVSSTLMGKDFIALLSNHSIKESIAKIKDKYCNCKDGIMLFNTILNVINSYAELDDYDKYKDYIIEELNQTLIPKNTLSNCIKVKPFSSYQYQEGDYVFIMEANYNVFPHIHKDEDYLLDKEKAQIGMPSSLQENEDEKNKIIAKLNKIKNAVITYHLSTPFTKAYPSFLNEEIKEINKNPIVNKTYSFSLLKDKFEFLRLKDDKNYNDNYYRLYQNVDNLIEKYDPSYKAISKEKIKEYFAVKKGLRLSYSSMNLYYQCKYRFFISHILKLDKFESSFATNIGNIFHEVLSHVYDKDFDFEKSYIEASSKYEFSDKEKFLLLKIKEELKFDIRLILEHYNEHTLFKNCALEKKIEINYEDETIPLSFIGIIDKTLWYEDNDQKYIVIIDYKSGNSEIDLKHMEYGVGLQLPVYLYLASKNSLFSDFKVAGFYLQKILPEEQKRTLNKTREETRENLIKLDGYTINDASIIAKFDDTYSLSKFIKNMKTTSNGFYSYAKLMDQENMNSLIELVDNKIKESFDNILKANFEIAPLEVEENNSTKNIGCKYCNFKDVCFFNYQNKEEEEGKINGEYELDR